MRNGQRDKKNGSRNDERFGMNMVAHRSSEARKQIMVWKSSLARQAKQHPGRSIAIAIGAGYLLGGGLFSRLTMRMLATGIRLGLRLAVVPLVTQGIVTLGEGLLDRGDGDGGDEDSDSSSGRSGARHNRSHSDQKETHS